jgi:hypothetical protein
MRLELGLRRKKRRPRGCCCLLCCLRSMENAQARVRAVLHDTPCEQTKKGLSKPSLHLTPMRKAVGRSLLHLRGEHGSLGR